MEKRYNSFWNYEGTEKRKETPTGESMTMPGQSYTVQELFDRSQKGFMPPNAKVGQFQDDIDFEDVSFSEIMTMDLVDRADLVASNAQKIEVLQQTIEDAKKASQEPQEDPQEPPADPPPSE